MLNRKRVDRLYARQTHGIKPGLDSVRALLAKLGNPEKGLAAVHVAGTNGKGSVCALLAAALGVGKPSVGLYTSPHLVSLQERFVIDGAPIDESGLDGLLAEVEDAAEAVEREERLTPTFFECTTAAAFLHFQRRGARLALIETGMGGRLDATNVLTPLLCVITRVGLDHREHLGETIEAIAAEKAGIIKPGRPVVLGAMPEEARAVMLRTARELGVALVDAAESVSVRRLSGTLSTQKVRVASGTRDYGTLSCALAASYQVENIATAVAAIEALEACAGLTLPDTAVAEALRRVRWPGRFQLAQQNPPLLVDGAHNPDGARALVRALKDAKASHRVGLVCGFCSDKDVDGFFRTVAPLARRIWAVPVPNPRSMPPEETARHAERYRLPCTVETEVRSALESAQRWALQEDGVVVVCGSLFLAGEVLAQRKLLPSS